MVQKNLSKKSYLAANGRKIISAIAFAAIAGLLLPNFSLAAFKITENDIASLKEALSRIEYLINFGSFFLDPNSKAALNMGLGAAETGTDITYGIVALSALNEFDLIDLVSSQRYKDEAKNYFNTVLDERLDLRKRLENSGIDISKTVFTNAINGQMSALTLNSFAIVNKSVAILASLHMLQQEKFYDGIWRYFDSRRNLEDHQTAWEDALAEMGSVSYSLYFWNSPDLQNEQLRNLSLHFSDLWRTWGPYTNEFGIKPEAKEKFATEMNSLFAAALEKQKNAPAEQSFFANLIESLKNRVAQLRNTLMDLASRLDPRRLLSGIFARLFAQAENPATPSGSPAASNEPAKNQEQIDNLLEEIDLLERQIADLEANPPANEPSPTPTPSPGQSPEPGLNTDASLASAGNNLSSTPGPSLSASPSPGAGPSPSPSPSPSLSPSPSPSPSYSPPALPAASPASGGTADSVAPVISEVKIYPAKHSAVITWQTDEKSTGRVEFGLDQTYGSSVNDNALSKTHSVFLSYFNPKTDYHFKIYSNDSHDNESSTTDSVFSTFGSLVINEVQTGETEFVEIYNPENTAVSIANFYLSYYSENKDWDKPHRQWQLPAAANVPAQGYYLIGIYGYHEGSGDPASDWEVKNSDGSAYSAGQFNSASGGVALFVWNPREQAINENQTGKLDALGWGTAQVVETQSATASPANQSMERIVPGADTENNFQDFQIQTKPSPTNSLGQTKFYDLTLPDTSIVEPWPENPTLSTDASFSFASSKPNSTFECSLDDSLWTTCISPQNYTGLTPASHEFRTRAIDESSNIDPTPASYSWTILPPDTTPPETTIDSGPTNPTFETTASFTFSADDPLATFQCQLNSLGWEDCSSPKNYSSLTPGIHNFEVKAIDAVGNVDLSPATRSWEIQTPLPETIISLTNYAINNLNFTVNWTAAGVFDHYDVEIKIGNNAWQEWPVTPGQTSKDYFATEDFTLYQFRARTSDASGLNLGAWDYAEAKIATQAIVVNEIMYNPDPGLDDYYEYVELFNPTPFDINLAGWKIITDGNIAGQEQSLSADTNHNGSSTIIKAGGYALISDQTVGPQNIYDGLYYLIPDYSANAIRLQIGDAELGLLNSGGQNWITLKDQNNNVIDQFFYPADSLALTPGKPLEKRNPLYFSNDMDNWAEGQAQGTPNAANSVADTGLNNLVANHIINKDTIFSPVFGTYLVEGELVLAADKKLIIQPGTIIRFKEGYDTAHKGKMIINGQILAQGTAEQPIVFTADLSFDNLGTDSANYLTDTGSSYPTGPLPARWQYIEVEPTSQDSIFDYVVVRYGGADADYGTGTIARGSLRAVNTNITVRNSVFDTNMAAGLYLKDNNSLVENSIFRNHVWRYYYAGVDNLISTALWITQSSNPTLNNLTFQNNYYGVFAPSGASCALLPPITFSGNSVDCSNAVNPN